MSEIEQRIRDLTASGQKIEALKLLRQSTGLGLAEAKAALDALEAGGSLPKLEAKPPLPAGLPPDVRATAEGGDRVRAIQMLRERTGLGLAEAKAWIDRDTPSLSGRRGCLPVLLAGLALGTAAWWRS